MRPNSLWYSVALAAALTFTLSAAAFDGTLKDTTGAPVTGAFCSLANEAFVPLVFEASDTSGKFSLEWKPEAKYLIVVPPRATHGEGIHSYAHPPRVYQVEKDGAHELTLPQGATLVLHAYAPDGKLMLWEDFAKNGVLGGQFVHATTLDYIDVPCQRWHVPRPGAGFGDDKRETSVPVVVVEPGKKVAIEFPYWQTEGYGKLLLRADNGGKGYDLKAGEHVVVEVNTELARTALSNLNRRKKNFSETHQQEIGSLESEFSAALKLEAPKRAKTMDALLVEALRLRDEAELAFARESALKVRSGGLKVSGEAAADFKFELRPKSHHFLFGGYEGAPYNANAWEHGRKAGLELATVLLGWDWTKNPKLNGGNIDRQYGLSKLIDAGYLLKGHGIVWMQGAPIMPKDAVSLEHEELLKRALEQQQVLLEVFGKDLSIIEAINEPANTNVPKISKEQMMSLLTSAAEAAGKLEKPVLVNSPHEFTYGWQYSVYNPDGTPTDAHSETFLDFLKRVQKSGEWDDVDIIGLQIYPGAHFDDPLLPGVESPCISPSHLVDLLDAYAALGKTIHITEFSMPSKYESDWNTGYWREKWDEETQADYVEAMVTVAYAHPQVRSFSWWDITDKKPSVAHGGLVRADGSWKPAMERLAKLIGEWHKPVEGDASTESLSAPAGSYTLRITKDGKLVNEREVTVLEGFSQTVEIENKS